MEYGPNALEMIVRLAPTGLVLELERTRRATGSCILDLRFIITVVN